MPTAQDHTGGHLNLYYGPGNHPSDNTLSSKGLLATVNDAGGYWLRNWTISNEGSSKIWVMLFDSTTQPGNGSSPVLIAVPLGPEIVGSWDVVPPIRFSHGIYWIVSSTPGTLTYQSTATVAITVAY